MAKKDQMIRLKSIESFLRRRGAAGASFAEIARELEERFEEKDLELRFTERTFLRDKATIFDVSGIEISYSRSRNVYYISNEELDQYRENIFDNLLLVEAYREVKDKNDIMLFEQRKSRGLNQLHGLVHAILNRKVITFSYCKFWTGIKEERKVQPYALKEFRNRWYLLAQDCNATEENLTIKTFGLDRISGLEILSRHFERKPYDAAQAFKHSFGIICGTERSEQPTEVRLWFEPHQANYIKALPLHPSQEVVAEDADGVVFKLLIAPTYDFRQEILSYGPRCRVVFPTELVQQIKKELSECLSAYGAETS
ncbi:MAG: WYL domain-containing protein [Chryseobacterium sp.]|nr:MAG: WYL domain-containing protein [Chryseobacterium sp.]